jgi:glycosyltransferase involved in cell wall biosynthesis
MLLMNILARGGAERQALELARGLDRNRFHVSVCAMRSGGPLRAAFEDAGVPVVELRKRMPADPLRLLDLARLLRRERVDIVHAFLTPQIVWGYLVSRLARVRAFLPSVRNAGTDEPAWWEPPLRFVLRRTPVIHANAAATVDFLKARGLAKPEQVVVVPNGVDLSRFGPQVTRGEYRRRLGLGEGALLVGTVGRLAPQKNMPLFLQMAQRIRAQEPAAEFVIAGDGPLREELGRMASALGVSEYVRFLGEIDDVPLLMADLDVFVLSSDWEGMPNVVAEAMAARTPVVATAVSGTPELVQDGRTGLLTPPGSVEELTNAVLPLLRDPDLRRRMGEAGRARIEDHFTVQRMVQRIEGLYDRLCPQ